jgi:hypothetical protein
VFAYMFPPAEAEAGVCVYMNAFDAQMTHVVLLLERGPSCLNDHQRVNYPHSLKSDEQFRMAFRATELAIKSRSVDAVLVACPRLTPW